MRHLKYIILFLVFCPAILVAQNTRYVKSGSGGGDWDSDIWSYTSGGASCTPCTPDQNSEVHVESGKTVDVNVAATTKNLTVYSGGLVQFTAATEINFENGGTITVDAGGEIDRNGNTSQFDFNDALTYNLICNDGANGISIDDIEMNQDAAVLNISGMGIISLTDDLIFANGYEDATVNCSMTGTFTVGDDILFNDATDNSHVINSGNMIVQDQIWVQSGNDDGSDITNSGNFTVNGNVVPNEATFDIFNTGVWDQNGDFPNGDNGATNIINEGGGEFYLAGDILDVDLELDCNNSPNTFIYDENGDQDIRIPFGNDYWHLTLTSTGNSVKESQADIDLLGDLTISGMASLDLNTNNYNLNLEGNWTNTSTHADPLDDANQTITFDGTGDQTINTTGGETFYNLNISKASGTIVLESDVTVGNNLALDGNVDAVTNDKTLIITNTATGGFDGGDYTSGSVIGKVERYVANNGGPYIFPTGTAANYNPATVDFQASAGNGSLIIEFKEGDPGSTGFPLTESGINMIEQFTEGYWAFTAANGLTSTDYDIDLVATGFTSQPISPDVRVLKRTPAGSWVLDGTHVAGVVATSTLSRDAFSDISSFEFGLTRTDANARYSITSGNWNDGNTWSYTSEGGTCSCTPDEFSQVFIESPDVVDLNVSGDVTDITVKNGGQLRWTGSNTLNIKNGGDVIVEGGGSMIKNGNVAEMDFDDDGTYTLSVNDATTGIDINAIRINAVCTLTVSGTGIINLANEFEFLAASAVVTNNLTGNFTITGDMDLDDSAVEVEENKFINNGTLVFDNLVSNADDDHIFYLTNNGTMTFNDVDGEGSDNDESDFYIYNYGTIDQNGDFLNAKLDNGIRIYNYAGATYKWSGSVYDPVMLQPDLSVITTQTPFIYDRDGNQDIIRTNGDAYWNLTLSSTNDGIKESQASFTVKGDVLVSEKASLDMDTNTDNLTLAGDFTITSTHADPFDQGAAAETVTFNGTANQTITVADGELFRNFTVNKTSGTLILANDVSIDNELDMIAGNIDCNANNKTLTLGTSTANIGTMTHTGATTTIVGKFERYLNATATNYLFPIGTSSNYHAISINFDALGTSGSIISEFFGSDPGNTNIPIAEGTINVINQFTEGYWKMIAANSLASTSYDVDLVGTGFSSYSFSSEIRVLERTTGSGWSDPIPGTHVASTISTLTAERDNITTGISATGTEFGMGKTDADARYAIADGDWDADIWSFTSGGASCTPCTPASDKEVHIENTYDVTLNVAGDCKDLTVYSGGTLTWTAGVDLNMHSGGTLTIENGGKVDVDVQTGNLDFEDAATYTIVVNDATNGLNVTDMRFIVSNQKVNVSGAGLITLDDDLVFNTSIDNVKLTNSMSGSFLILDDVLFLNGTDFDTIVNTGNMTITDDVFINDNGEDNHRITNSGSITINGDINASNATFYMDNTGTWDQNGNLPNNENGATDIVNEAGAIFYMGGLFGDVDTDLDCNNSANTFLYDRNGDQDILDAVGNDYWHLTLTSSGNGIKEAQANIDIEGNLIVSSLASMDVDLNTVNVNVAGDVTISSTHADPLDQGAATETFVFDGTADQTLTTAATELFNNIEVNKASGTVILASSVQIDDELTMTAGNIDCATNGVTLTLGTGTGNTGTLTHTGATTTIIGKFERWLNATAIDYLFPIGTSSNYNGATINFGALGTSGSLISQFIATDPGVGDLPLSENSLDVEAQFTEGYWQFVPANSIASVDYTVDLTANGFSSYPITSDVRVIRRLTSTPGTWIDPISGTHFAVDVVNKICYRNNITAGFDVTGTEFALGRTNGNNRYSIVDGGNWSDGATWSLTSGGGTCNCTPNTDTEVHIENTYDINFDVNGTTKKVTVYTGGTLNWTASTSLNITQDGGVIVETGASINQGAFDAEIEFDGAGTNVLTVDDVTTGVNVDDIEINASSSTLNISGAGKISVTDDFEFGFGVTNAVVNNAFTGNFTITDRLYFDDDTDSDSFINTGTVTVTNDIAVQSDNDDNNIVNNSGTFTLGDDLSPADATFQLINSGTFDMNGDFTSTGNGATSIYNNAGGTFNWSGSAYDLTMSLFCDYDANTFNYDRTGVQNIITPNDGSNNSYWNITLSGSSAKTTLADLDINGNLSIEGTAVLDVTTGNDAITIDGNWSNTSAAGDPFLEGGDNANETVTFQGTSDQTITNASGETFYNLTNNKASGNLILAGDVIVSGVLTMTAGNIDASTNSKKLTLGTNTGNIGALTHSGTTTILGQFERWMNATGTNYLFPVGTSTTYNPATYNFTNLTDGSLVVQFIGSDPGATGLPFDDGAITMLRQFSDGYWKNIPANSLASTDFDLDITATGFTSENFTGATRVLRRTTAGGSWLDPITGTHEAGDTPTKTAKRNNITSGFAASGTEFGLGKANADYRYSILDGGNWGTSGTWAYSSGGGTCGCTPDADSEVYIEAGYDINLNTTTNVKVIDIASTGTLTWTGDYTINMIDGGSLTIASGGKIDQGANVGIIELDDAATYTFTVNDLTNGLDITDLRFNAAATVALNGSGLYNITDDLEFLSSSAAVTSNVTGTFNVGDDLYFDGNSNSLTITSGTISVTDDLAVQSITDVSNSISNAGTLNIGDDITINDAPFTITNTGTLDIDGDFTNNSNGSTDIYNQAGGTFNWGGTNSDLDLDIYANYNANTVDFNAAGVQTFVSAADNYWNLTISGSGAKTTTGNLDIDGILSIAGTAQLDVNTNNANIAIAKDWTTTSGHANPLDQGGGSESITFDGSVTQTITNAAGESMNSIVVNKSGGTLDLSGTVTVSTSLTLTSGVVNTTSVNLLTLADGATASAGSANSYVDGPLKKVGNEAFVFPIGDNGQWRRIGISAPTTSTTEYTAEYLNNNPTTDGYNPGSTGTGINNASQIEYWTLDQAVNDDDVTITIYWEDAAASKINDCTDDLTLVHWTGSQWDNEEATATGTCSGNGSGSVTTDAVVATYSPFTFGSKSGGANALPIELGAFTSHLTGNIVIVKWETLSEINNAYFILEHSTDGENFGGIHIEPGEEFSSELLTYSFTHDDPAAGWNYYRLTQVDLDGTETVFETITVERPKTATASKSFGEMVVFPNPVSNGTVNILGKTNTKSVKEVLLVMTDLYGRTAYSKALVSDANGEFITSLEFSEALPTGLYFITHSSVDGLVTKRLMVK